MSQMKFQSCLPPDDDDTFPSLYKARSCTFTDNMYALAHTKAQHTRVHWQATLPPDTRPPTHVHTPTHTHIHTFSKDLTLSFEKTQ